MKKKKLLQALLLATTALTLAACGGGDDSNPTITPSEKPETKPETKPNPENNQTIQGYSTSGTEIKTTSSAKVDELVIDGQKIALTSPGISAGEISTTWGNISINGVKQPAKSVSGTNYSYTKFGAVLVNDKTHVFAQGNATPATEVPTTGTFTYTGNAIQANGVAEPSVGDSSFKVDFAAKKLDGTLTYEKSSVGINANISGNTFSGNANGVETKGGFYGPKAAELSGVYKQGETTGSYGAKKQ